MPLKEPIAAIQRGLTAAVAVEGKTLLGPVAFPGFTTQAGKTIANPPSRKVNILRLPALFVSSTSASQSPTQSMLAGMQYGISPARPAVWGGSADCCAIWELCPSQDGGAFSLCYVAAAAATCE